MHKTAQSIINHLKGEETEHSRKLMTEIANRLTKAGCKSPFTVTKVVLKTKSARDA